MNLRSRQALIYGYVVPVFFLFAFGTLFRWDHPPLLARMGQLLTISTLGGACFGMPTGMVAERERGVWRRYRLLPGGTRGLITSTMISRALIIGSAALLQILLARVVYGTPFPEHPLVLTGVFLFVAFSFEGLGLVVAALADTVPAVQALGQAIFLPMIMVGGVGVPLTNLPDWAQTLAGFFPGRYAVEALQPCFDGNPRFGFPLLALAVIGIAGCVAGGRLFRWDANQRVSASGAPWVVLAMASWIAVGLAALSTGRLKPVGVPSTSTSARQQRRAATRPQPWDAITTDQINSLTFTGLPDERGTIAPLAPPDFTLPVPEDRERMDQLVQKLDAWPPGHLADAGQCVRNLFSVAAIADYTQDSLEAPLARTIFEQLKSSYDHEKLIRILTWMSLTPDQGTVIRTAPELGLPGPVNEDVVRSRIFIYSRRLLGRLLGKLPDVQPQS